MNGYLLSDYNLQSCLIPVFSMEGSTPISGHCQAGSDPGSLVVGNAVGLGGRSASDEKNENENGQDIGKHGQNLGGNSKASAAQNDCQSLRDFYEEIKTDNQLRTDLL